MLELPGKKFILWDHDGVLVDTEKWYFEATRKALAELDITFSKDLYLDYMQDGKSLWTLAGEAGITDEIIHRYKARRNQYYQDYLVRENIEIPGVIDTLRILSDNYSMAIVTTSKRKDFELIHRERSIINYMDFVLTIEDYKSAKPDPDPFLAALKKYNASPVDAVVIEDSGRGLKAAVSAGIDCIIVENEFTRRHDFSKALMVVPSITELIGLLSIPGR